MVSIRVIGVGKLKEAYWEQAAAEYQKRLGAFCRLEVVSVREHKLPDRPSPAEISRALQKEGANILSNIPDGAKTIALCVEGKPLSSEALAARLAGDMAGGVSSFVFLVGGSYGLGEGVKQRADLCLSFSAMTFPHHMMRVLLLEQLYRAFHINGGGQYHK